MLHVFTWTPNTVLSESSTVILNTGEFDGSYTIIHYIAGDKDENKMTHKQVFTDSSL